MLWRPVYPVESYKEWGNMNERMMVAMEAGLSCQGEESEVTKSEDKRNMKAKG